MSATYEPHLYDLTTVASFKGDLDFYRRQARERGGPVLELGAGTGRITLALARDGVTVHALDANLAMLDALTDKLAQESPEVRNRVVIVEGDMRTFKLPERFPLIICPFRAFLHNLTEDDQLSCLRQVCAHLAPAGTFAFNVFYPTLEVMARHTAAHEGVWRWVATFPRPGGGFITRSDAIKYDPVRQRVQSMLRYEEFGANGVLMRTFVHPLELAYLYPGDIRRLAQEAGFGRVHITGDANGRAVESDGDELFIEAVISSPP